MSGGGPTGSTPSRLRLLTASALLALTACGSSHTGNPTARRDAEQACQLFRQQNGKQSQQAVGLLRRALSVAAAAESADPSWEALTDALRTFLKLQQLFAQHGAAAIRTDPSGAQAARTLVTICETTH